MLHLEFARSSHSSWSRGDAFGGMFGEVVLVLRHHPDCQELGFSQQQRDASEIICTPNEPSSTRSTNAGGCSSLAMSADHYLAPALSLKAEECEFAARLAAAVRSREEAAKPARQGLIISIAIVSSLWGPLAHFASGR